MIFKTIFRRKSMRFRTSLGILSATAIIALSSCSNNTTQPAPQVSQMPQEDPNKCYRGIGQNRYIAPDWICNPYIDGGISAIGISKATMVDESFMMTEAMADARDKIARQLETKVKNMFKKFTQVTGTGEDATVEKVATDVSKQVANQTLSGVKMHRSWQAPDGTLYVWAVLDPQGVQQFKENTIQQMKKVKTSMGNKEALYQQFLAERAMKELDAEIDKEMGQ